MSDVNPYQPSPVSDEPAVPSVGSLNGAAYTYVSAAGRVTVLSVLFAITILWDVVLIGFDLMAIGGNVDAWGDIQIGDNFYHSFWITYAAVGLLYLPIAIATVVAFCMWIHRSNANARALGAAGMTFTPGWSVGWFFIPFMNLVRPFQAVRELYQASDPDRGPLDWRRPSAAGIVKLWWTLWVVTSILSRIESRMGESDDPETVIASCWVGLLGSCLGIVLCVTVTKLIRSIQARLHRKAIKLGVADEFSD